MTPRSLIATLLRVLATLSLLATGLASETVAGSAIAAGTGSTWAWGFNASGQLGNGNTSNVATPAAVSMPAGVTSSAVSAGGYHTLALDTRGHAWAWGLNYYGQLGNATTTDSATPVEVSMPTKVTFSAVSAGLYQSLALDTSGQAWAWGSNALGQLGNGTTTDSSTPVAVTMPAGVTFTAISSGGYHNLALDNRGRAWAWGSNGYYTLGNGTSTDSSTPVAVSMPTGVTFSAISAAYLHSLALDSGGHAWAWGSDGNGLGNGTIGAASASSTPVAVSMPIGVTFSAISAVGYHSLALDSGGRAWAWGDNSAGQLGNGTTAGSFTTPTAVSMPTGITFSAIAAGGLHSLALDSGGHAWAWGYNRQYELGNGDGTTADSPTPTAVSMPTGVTFGAISAGFFHSLALVTASGSPDPAISPTGTTFNATEGASFSGTVASFTDPDTSASASEHSASIDWGDGQSSSGTVSATAGGFAVAGTHTYAEEGSHTVTVGITDTDNAANAVTATSTVSVSDAALSAACATPVNSTQSFSGTVATVADAAGRFGMLSDLSATIDWGDSTISPGTLNGPHGGPFTVSGSHTYTSTGTYAIGVTVSDAGGASTTVSACRVLVFAFPPGGGDFVIGDNNSAGGTAVTFWGAQWWRHNSVSGGVAAARFKGFAEFPATPGCGTGWNTDRGDSAPPPNGPLPAFMGVIVTSSTSQTGSQTSGDIAHIVVVRTDPGYQPDPAHPGTGTVVTQVC